MPPTTTNGACLSSPCLNGGICEDPWYYPDYLCHCSPEWSGRNCEYYVGGMTTTTEHPITTAGVCQCNPCYNGGTCVDQQYYYPYYRCYCMPGTSGARCEYAAGCWLRPCHNGGTCVDLGFPNYQCICNSRWSGLDCENPVREVELMNCTSRYMELQIPLSELSELGLSSSDVHLEDPSCRGSISGQYLVLHTDLHGCGSTLETHDDNIVYSNTAYGFVAGTRAKKLRIPMHCYLGAEGRVIASFAPRVYDKYSSGTFDLSIAIYTSQAFSQAVRAYPFEVDLGAPIYAEVLLNSYDNSLQLLLETCKASPNPGTADSESYVIIRDGCQVDPSYTTYSSGDEKRQHFSFQSVEFFSGSQVYLECNVRVCNISDVSSRCRRGCVRSKRSVRDLVGPENRAEHKVDLSQGPVLLRKTRQVSGLSSSALGLVYALAAALTVTAVCVAVVKLYGIRSRATQYELIVPIDD
ncbi:CUB and zona pellucida-like domain-containing protein 1 [Lethenteron reissneri]|uniref:CUB and zona pellucida-like domain-containing protein 1 n=1 Tax=Lethenteron reissneri TaxID=7753 RepID=UPI002AB78E23|nr:CUB and zona pellucida-like domain-containing protein 1 [Lethenteron reissneri]